MPKDNGSLRNATTSVVATAAKMAASIAHTATTIPPLTTKQHERHHTQKPITGHTGRFRSCAGGERSTLQQRLILKKPHLIALLFGLLTALASCNSQSNTARSANTKTLASKENIRLDSKATMVYQDKKGTYWLASEDKGLYQYDGKRLNQFTSLDGLESYRILGVQEDTLGVLYFDTPDGVFRFDGASFYKIPIEPSLDDEHDWTSKAGGLWFRIGWDNKGPYRFDGEKLYPLTFPKNSMEDKFYQKNPNASFNPYAIYAMYEDSGGNVWFGTSNMGVYLFDGTDIFWIYEDHHMETPEGGNFGIRSIMEDDEGKFWISNSAYKYTILAPQSDGEGLQPLQYTRHDGVKNKAGDSQYFFAMEVDHNGDLIQFAGDSGTWLNDGKSLSPFYIEYKGQVLAPTSIFRDRQGSLWLGTAEDGIFQYGHNGFEKFKVQ